ncbi:4-hydroxybenzoate polyprenyl transferase [Coniophora puteana RWD-64-598 SS2]|uniref:4-hydroxybenzoate polyprenyltransferase, mitochondrial n=1 Tax=Coniophora puteana (strain RWD-64-598) TaxID=741705 RepID=A0A5M3ML85_CONPW|nr:4-hydroxybenzoate polyprenyl transferase [Coniophora puteana RWD-64-598 SS2]EIW79999.1 4-hydroxybenzoate polyprenyl transferase [Coniophora puteana RWD-64-598 SS2]
MHPYLELMRVHKPVGTWLMFWPFAWGLSLAARQQVIPLTRYAVLFLVFFFGAFFTRSTVCTLNDILDRDFDRQVERCKSRPIASGRVATKNAIVFYLMQLVVCLALSALMNKVAHHVYPLLKRWTNWPQAWLGLAMNWGLPVAWAAVARSMDLPVLSALLSGSWCWTVLYDTIYACQDMDDDRKAGIKSTALLFGEWILPLLRMFAVGLVSSLIVTGLLTDSGPLYYVISVVGVVLHLAWQFRTVDLHVPNSCGDIFKANSTIGFLIWAGLFGEYILSVYRS